MIYLVIYKEDNTIEGYINKREDFSNWFIAYNEDRKAYGELPEDEDEFRLKEINKLI